MHSFRYRWIPVKMRRNAHPAMNENQFKMQFARRWVMCDALQKAIHIVQLPSITIKHIDNVLISFHIGHTNIVRFFGLRHVIHWCRSLLTRWSAFFAVILMPRYTCIWKWTQQTPLLMDTRRLTLTSPSECIHNHLRRQYPNLMLSHLIFFRSGGDLATNVSVWPTFLAREQQRPASFAFGSLLKKHHLT